MFQITVLLSYAAAGGLWLRTKANLGPNWLPWLFALLAVVGHGYLLSQGSALSELGPGTEKLSFGATLSANGMLLGIAALALAAFRPSLRPVAGGLAIAAGLVSLGTKLGSSLTVGANVDQWPLLAHIGLSLVAATLFTLAAILATLLAVKERRLRGGVSAIGHLPPLETIENGMFLAIGGGFGVLSIAIVSGLGFVDDLAAQHLTHKTLLTLLAWLLFGGLLLARWRFGLRGRSARRWTLVAFGALVLAYFGSRFVLEVLLGRQWG